MHELDPSSFEPGTIRLKLRRDLAFQKHSVGGAVCYLVEDAATSRFFRIGPTEYMFASLLDGETTVAEALAHCASHAKENALTESQALALCAWLIRNSLASTDRSDSVARLLEQEESVTARKRREWLNPIMLKLPLGSPDAIVRAVAPLTSWCFGTVGFLLWTLIVSFGGYCVWMNFSAICRTQPVFAASNGLWLALTWLVLKLAHEAGHAISCQRGGGNTRDAGILLLLLVPLPYVDVTAAWRFGSRWRRIQVSAAGMYVEMFVAALAAIAWVHSDSELVRHHAVNVMFTASLITVLFNLNPLMRFDGYYILSDLFDLPNLATHGQQDLRSLAQRAFFGIRNKRPAWPEGRGAVIRLYGMAAFAWRVLVCVSLTCAAEMLYHGGGIVFACLAIAFWVVLPVGKLMRYVIVGDAINPPNRLRFATVCGLLVGAGYGVWNFVPYVDRLQVPAIVECDPVISIRTGTAGFVRSVEVKPGQTVGAEQVLVRLENPTLSSRIAETELALQQSELHAIRFHRRGRLAAFRIEQENAEALQKRLEELVAREAQLVVKSPIAGTILSRSISDLHDRWLPAGTTVCDLGDDCNRRVFALVPQSDISLARQAIEKPVAVRIHGREEPIAGTLDDIAARGSNTLRFPALSATAGGPLAIQPATQTANDGSPPEPQLLEPVFTARVRVVGSDMQNVGTGQTGVMELTRSRGTVGDVIRNAVRQFAAKNTARF